MSSGATAQDKAWQAKEKGDESRHAREREQAQLAALREQMAKAKDNKYSSRPDRDFEGGFGGQEDLEDRYATTSGEH